MPKLEKYLNCFQQIFGRNFPTFFLIIETMLVLADKKNMLSIHRWSGLAHRTIERFLDQRIPWITLNLFLFKLEKKSSELILACDETNVKKSGKRTYGLNLFFCSIVQRSIKSVCFSGLSIIDPKSKKSYPIVLNQLVIPKSEKKNKLKVRSGKRGRPPGVKNGIRQEKEIAHSFKLLNQQLEQFQGLKSGVNYLVGDGKYANQTVLEICDKQGLFLVSKLRMDSALYFPVKENSRKVGRKKLYGKRLDYSELDNPVEIKKEGKTLIQIFQIKGLRQKRNPYSLNVVVIQKMVSGKVGQIILFSSDLELSHEKMISYYQARFQIEFNFRDAKQFFGLKDFQNIKEIRIHNFANLAFFMVNLSQILLEDFRQQVGNVHSGLADLKMYFRAGKYLFEVKKIIRKFGNNFFIPSQVDEVLKLGLIHQ